MVEQEVGLIGITGASGQLGRRVLELVIERVGVARVVAITRSPEKLADFVAKGVEVRTGDFAQVDGLPTAFAGIDRLYVISIDDVTEGVRPRLHGNAINATKQVGVKHLVYSSAQGGAAAYVSREDCARAAAAVLTSSGHEGAIYDITGSYAFGHRLKLPVS